MKQTIRLLSGATATDPVFLLPILKYFGKFKQKSQEMQRNASTVMSLAKVTTAGIK
jgi:hypothetical protein